LTQFSNRPSRRYRAAVRAEKPRMSRMLCGVKNAECGVMTSRCLSQDSPLCQAAINGFSRFAGSSGNTSSPAANTTSLFMASWSASISITGPRAVLTMMIPGFAAAFLCTAVFSLATAPEPEAVAELENARRAVGRVF